MAMSGISVTAECLAAHERQFAKAKDVQWTIYKIAECAEDDCQQQHQQQHSKGKPKPKKKEIVVESVHKRDVSADDFRNKSKDEVMDCDRQLFWNFIGEMPEEEPRYAVLDFISPTSSGTANDKIKFITWSPDCCSIKQKMIYSSTKDSLKRKFSIESKETFICSKSREDVDEAFLKLFED